MRPTMRTAAGRPLGGRPAVHRRRHSKIFWLNVAALCVMAAGVAAAFAAAGRG
jgi:hypothetical protein